MKIQSQIHARLQASKTIQTIYVISSRLKGQNHINWGSNSGTRMTILNKVGNGEVHMGPEEREEAALRAPKSAIKHKS